MNISMTPRVLVVAPNHDGRGGIASVVQMHRRTAMWERMRCHLVCTFNDRSAVQKIWSALRGYLRAPAALWNADLLHLHLAGETSLLRKIPFLFLARTLKRRSVVHIHAASEESLFVKTPHWAWRYVFQSADAVIALSARWAEIIKRRVPGATVFVVPNPVRSFAPAPREHLHAPRVLYVGKLEHRKGYDTLLDAAAILHQEHPTAEFWFAGHGELEKATRYSDDLGLSQVVRFLGWQAEEQLASVYERVEVFCLPSRNEGVPMAMLEAMSHALPVVVTSVGGIPDVVHNGQNGLLVSPDDPVALAGAISRLLRETDLASALAKAGQVTVQSCCDLEAVGDQLVDVYERICVPIGTRRLDLA